MKKTLFLILALLLSLSACAQAGVPSSSSAASSVVSPSAMPTASPTAIDTGLPTVSPSPTPSQPGFVPDTDVPDIDTRQSDYILNSGFELYEDDNFIYYNGGYENAPPVVYNKVTKATKPMPINSESSVSNGKVYYNGGTKHFGYITEYDPQTGKAKNIFRLKGDSFTILAYKNIIYYTYCVDTRGEGNYELFSVTPEGKDNKVYAPIDVWDFSIYNNKIYYTDAGASDSPPIYVYDLKTHKNRELCSESWQEDPFRISNGKLYFSGFDDDDVTGNIGCIDLDTGKKEKMIDGISTFTLLGQYLFYTLNDALYAYDINTKKTYNLIELGDYNYQLYAAAENAYIALFTDSSNELDRIVISGGKASLEKVTEFSGGSN